LEKLTARFIEMLKREKMTMINTIKNNPRLKRIGLWLLMPAGQARPRWWVRWFLNPFVHRIHRSALVCSSVRFDVLPFRLFELGAHSTIEDFAVVNNGVGDVHIGHHVRVGIGSVVIGPVEIGSHVIIAQHVVMSGLNHGYEDTTKPIHLQPVSTCPIVIEDDSWIGANVVIVAGVRIGKHVVVAGGSVVTKDVPPYSVVAGNPAKVIRRFDAKTGKWEKTQIIQHYANKIS
jgi:acetyltransferase-like isoleucine patch superfamily enzyme